ncbi:MAG: nitrogen fixation protein NifM [Gammaproteobacteria bacterium 28-57-27]|nr:MAG: nitrogen fixation protein NifM [Gammaproteobacteria bacterium 28-57-27]
MSLSYCEFQVAQQLFGSTPDALDEAQRRRVSDVTQRRLEIERLVLASEEGRAVCVPEATLQQALQELRGRYEDEASFKAALEQIGLDDESLLLGLRRQLAVDAVLDRISAEGEAVSELDVELFYRLNSERFVNPERRRARHILITINEDFAENRRELALQRIQQAAGELSTRSFEDVAQRYSECPTAVNGGMLGELRRGQLYPELEEALFALWVGETSGVVESELGFHLVRCDAVFSEQRESLEQAAPRIREHLHDKQAQQRQRAWLAQLAAQSASPSQSVQKETSHATQ